MMPVIPHIISEAFKDLNYKEKLNGLKQMKIFTRKICKYCCSNKWQKKVTNKN